MSTATRYEWNATEYSGKSSAQAAWAEEVIARLNLQPTDHVLDIGCGDGKITARIAALVPQGRVVGIDSSESMVAFATEHYGDRAPHLTFQVADASNLKFDGEFDAIFSNAVLHWIRDHAPVLRGIRKALRPGGRASMQFGGRGNAEEVRQVMEEIRQRAEWQPYFNGFKSAYNFYGPEEYTDWLEAAGLICERVELVSRPMRHTSEQFKGWLTTTWMPYTSRVPEERRERFVDATVTRFIQLYPPDTTGTLTIPMIRLNVDARRP